MSVLCRVGSVTAVLFVLACNKSPEGLATPVIASTAIAAIAASVATSAATAAPSAAPQAASAARPTQTRRFLVSDGADRPLGTVEVPPGGPAKLTLSVGPDEGKKLRALIDELAVKETISVTMHDQPPSGSRPYEARDWKRGASNYGEGVWMKLVDSGFGAKEVGGR